MVHKVLKKIDVILFIIGILVGLSIELVVLSYFKNLFPTRCDKPVLQNVNFGDEFNVKRSLFIGVMTSKKFLNNRAKAIYKTWGRNFLPNLVFFSSSNSLSYLDLPLISLPNVDDSYPPQKKSFLMIIYMYDNFLDKFEWFMRADDDLYVKKDKLELLLKSLDSNKKYYIGQPGLGNREEYGKMNLNDDEFYCIGGSGVLMSQKTLSILGPNIRKCLKNLQTYHEDVELGRCIKKFVNITCTSSYEMKEIFIQKKEEYYYNPSIEQLSKSITNHPIKNSSYIYKLHMLTVLQKLYDLKNQCRKLDREKFELKRDLSISHDRGLIYKTRHTYNEHNFDFLINNSKLNRNQSIEFDLLTKSIISAKHDTPRRKIEGFWKKTIDKTLNTIVSYLLKNKHDKEYKEVLYGYCRYNPLNGIDYIFSILFVSLNKDLGKKLNFVANFYVRSSFSNLEFKKEITDSHQKTQVNKLINFVITLHQRWKIFKNFMLNYENVCLKKNENTKLLIVLFEDSNSEKIFNNKNFSHSQSYLTQNLIDNLNSKYKLKNGKKIKLITRHSKFSRSIGCQIGSSYYSKDDLIYFIDVDMKINNEFLFRVRLNTIQHKQVYFPIMFSKYPSHSKNEEKFDYKFKSDIGYWRQYSFGNLCVYNSDLIQIGGFDVTHVGWGVEDQELFNRFLKSNLTVLRCVDPGLIHIFHAIKCDPVLPKHKLDMCLGTKLTTSFGSQRYLANLYYKTHSIMFKKKKFFSNFSKKFI